MTNKKDLPAFLKNDPVQKPKEEDLVREELNRKMVELQELTVRLRTDHADIEENKRLYEMVSVCH